MTVMSKAAAVAMATVAADSAMPTIHLIRRVSSAARSAFVARCSALTALLKTSTIVSACGSRMPASRS